MRVQNSKAPENPALSVVLQLLVSLLRHGQLCLRVLNGSLKLVLVAAQIVWRQRGRRAGQRFMQHRQVRSGRIPAVDRQQATCCPNSPMTPFIFSYLRCKSENAVSVLRRSSSACATSALNFTTCRERKRNDGVNQRLCVASGVRANQWESLSRC